jgi:hypothetical protein
LLALLLFTVTRISSSLGKTVTKACKPLDCI